MDNAVSCFPRSETRGQLRLKGRLLGLPQTEEWGITALGTQWLHFLSKGRVEASPQPLPPAGYLREGTELESSGRVRA